MKKYLLILLLVSCAGAGTVVLKLRDRRLLICTDKSGLCWRHEECKPKAHWYSKQECYWDDGFQDLTDPIKRKELIDMDFSCTSSGRFKN